MQLVPLTAAGVPRMPRLVSSWAGRRMAQGCWLTAPGAGWTCGSSCTRASRG